MITGKINSIIYVGAQAASSGQVVAGAVGVAAAVAVGFLFIFNEASYQKRALRQTTGYRFGDDQPHPACTAFHTAATNDNRLTVSVKSPGKDQPLFAGEMIAVARALARRVMEGTAHIAELLSMMDELQRMGISIQGLFSFGAALLAPKFNREEAELNKAA